MSHLRTRKETDCLNCNAKIYGRYCHVCGQENLEKAETVGHLIKHFIYDLTHFDGKFFSTIKYLITKPGFVSREYALGRRTKYLNPIRMYIFTSAAFFFVFFSVIDINNSIIQSSNLNGKSYEQIQKLDSLDFAEMTKDVNNGVVLSRDEFALKYDSLVGSRGLSVTNTDYRSKAQYDSLLASGEKDHNWFQRMLIYKEIELKEKYGNDGKKILGAIVNTLFHYFPQALFFSLPLFALILRLLYYRRKQFYYASHIIFSLHLHIVVFFIFFFQVLFTKLRSATGWDGYTTIATVLTLLIFVYEFFALKNFYRQSTAKTFLKFVLLNIMHFIIIMILFLIFLIISFLKS